MKIVKTDEAKITLQIMLNKEETNALLMLHINNGIWQQVILPKEIVKEKFSDVNLWKHLVKFFIKD